MDSEDNACNILEGMLIDENAEPMHLPLSLLKSITNNFSDDLVIVTDKFGVFYKGRLRNGTVIVKKLAQTVDIDERFYQEINRLMRVKHKNIVRFLGYCSDTQKKVFKINGEYFVAEERHRILCFEFLPKWSRTKYISGASQGLDRITRYQITKGICEGLHYLHQQEILHLDLNPSKILLHCNMVPEIKCFSISRGFEEMQTKLLPRVKVYREQRLERGTIIYWLSKTVCMNNKLSIGSPHKTRRDAVSYIEKVEVTSMDVAPVSYSLGAMGSLFRKLDLLLAPNYTLRRSLKHAIKLLKEDVEEVSAVLVEQSMVDSPSNKAKSWTDEVRELSYDMEDCIDNMMRSHSATGTKVRSVRHFKIARLKINRLPKLLKPSSRMARIAEIRALLREASERHERYQLDERHERSSNAPRFAFTGSTHSLGLALCQPSADIIGVEDSRKELTEWLTNHEEKQLKVLCIIGSAGVGKTTLTRSLYRELKGQFECRLVIRMSQKPDMSKIIGEIISEVQGPKQIPDGSSLQNSIDSIREHLQDKRYFIVIDDLWDATPWDILKNAFPKGNNCSRIIVTTEFRDVAAKCNGYHSVTSFEIKPLVTQDSEKLFLQRVFGSDHHCPDKLKEVSSRIIHASGGLPLAIIMMAGLLTSELNNTDLWNQLQQCFFPSLAILSLEQRLEKVLNLCYKSLPQSLKTCLLYLTIFPEGSTIWKVDLLKQWIAEGFVSPTKGKDGVAESYFDELVNRGMIQPEKINHEGEVLSFTVHHVVFDLISQKSREEKFVNVADYSQTVTVSPMKMHRLSLQFSCATYASKPEGIRLSQVRSLAFFGLPGCMPSITKFKHLRVLDLELWGNYGDCTTLNLSGLDRLFHLRYLKVACHTFVELPSQIHGLQFLETLEIDAKVSDIPVDIVYLPSLLHLSFRDGAKLPDGIGGITSLQSLKYFDLGSNSEDNVRSLGGLINLHELHLTCSASSSDEHHLKRNLLALSSTIHRLANLKYLTLAPGSMGAPVFVVMFSIPIFLQRLELLSPICTFSVLPECIAKLQGLRTLKCSVREFGQEDIDILAGLPILTYLSLLVRRPTSESMIFDSGAFPVLKYFKYQCGSMCLSFKNEALPSLLRLKLGFNVHRGEQYAHMITGVENLLNLKKITVQIGADGGAESDRRAAEIAFRDAINKHTRFRYFVNVKRVDKIEEEKLLCLPIPTRGVRANVALAAMELIKRWELQTAHRLVFDSQENAEEYIAAATYLMGSPGPHAEEARHVAMARIEKDIRQLLICKVSLTGPSSNSSIKGDDSIDADGEKLLSDVDISSYLISAENVDILKDFADIMLRSGYASYLYQAYIEVRRDRLMECLAVLGVDKTSLEEVHLMEWKVLDEKMKKWIHALKVVVLNLLPEECRICSQILATAPNPEEFFTEVAKGSVLRLLKFGNAVATGKRSPEKLFHILGMYEALAEVLPELKALFSGQTRDFINQEAERILARLGKAMRETIIEFSSIIQGHTSQRPLPGWRIHPLTRYVMNYVRLLGDNGHCVLMLISYLQGNIEERSRLYKDEALQNIFLMNNLQYMVQKVKDSELKTVLGDNWILKCRGQIRQYSIGYLRSSWTRALAWLRDDDLPHTTGSSSALKDALKDRFKNFNLAFEELYRTQTSWIVINPQLREELKISIYKKVLPAYQSFLGRFRHQLEEGRSSAKYMKYDPDDLENMISDFFEGNGKKIQHLNSGGEADQ